MKRLKDMFNVKASLATILALVSIKSATIISKECGIFNGTLFCRCDGNKVFYLPDNYNYKNATGFMLSSCSNAELLWPSLSEAVNMTELVISDIDKRLNLELMLGARNLSLFQLSNVKEIPVIKSDLLISLKEVRDYILRNVFIENFEEHFTEMRVVNLLMENVTINHVEGFNFTEKGENLRIINCVFGKITKSLNFHFENVMISNTRFEMQKPEYFHVNSNFAFLQNNTFVNISMDVVGKTTVTVNDTCADGQSNLRLSSFDINSVNNKWPTAIIYSPNDQNELNIPYQSNNVVCVAGNCQCPKSSSPNGNQKITATFFLDILLVWLTYMMSRQ